MKDCKHTNTEKLYIPRANHWWYWCKNCGALASASDSIFSGKEVLEAWRLPKGHDDDH